MSDSETVVARMVREVLHVVRWEDCTLHKDRIVDPKDHIAQAVLDAAKKLKALGMSWEEWT